MSEYNAKNYTEQGGEVTHIGGKLVIDDGADISALIAAISDAGKMSVCDKPESLYGKQLSDLVDEDVKILAGGVVTGHIKYVEDYAGAFSGDEAKGHFFPVHLSDAYKGRKSRSNVKAAKAARRKPQKIRTGCCD